MKPELNDKVITALGPIDPGGMGAVLMHEHLHSDWAQLAEEPFDMAKWPVIEKLAVPYLRRSWEQGCFAYVDMSRPPERAAPWVYREVSEMSGVHIVVTTGYYREIELGKYWAQTPEDQIWPLVREQPVEALQEFCLREIEDGIHGSEVHPGVLKCASSSAELTEVERKTFVAIARVQKQTGLFVSTHCTAAGAHVTQLAALESGGVDPERVVLGHTQGQMVNEWPTVRECMRRGATFLMTNLAMDVAEKVRQGWTTAIKRAFDEGFGDRVTLGLDSYFAVGYADLMANPRWRPHQGDSTLLMPSARFEPFIYMFTHTLPRFREIGITEDMIRVMMVENPKRVMPVRM